MKGQIRSEEKIQEIKGAFKINCTTKVFDLAADSKIDRLNNLWNQNFQNNKDIISHIITERSQLVYECSAYFAEQVSEKEFDGILYKPSTIISNAPLGPCNDYMLVLFEPKQNGRQLFRFYHSS